RRRAAPQGTCPYQPDQDPHHRAGWSQSQGLLSAQRTLAKHYADNEAVQRVLPGYVEDLPKRVAEMSAYLAARRLEELRRIVHQMKGSGGGYGFPDITHAAASAESSIKAHVEIEKIEMSVKELCTLIRSVEGYEPAKESASAGQADF